MGSIRFAVCPGTPLSNWPEVLGGYLVGADGRVFPTRIEIDGNIVSCRRSSSESAKFHVGWPVKDFGNLVLTTASLPERDQPYLLPVELARGKLVQVRNQAATWELSGLKLSEEFDNHSKAAHKSFFSSASSQDRPEEACKLANSAIHSACLAADALTRSYAAQSIAGRLLRFGTLPFSIGCDLQGNLPSLKTSDLFGSLFNTAAVSASWKSIESVEGEYNWELTDQQLDWCEDQKMMVWGGPLLDLGADSLPTWLGRWENDLLNLQSFVCDFVETAVSRYVGRIRVWEICTRMNTGGALKLSEENRLTLTARVLDVARQVDEESQLIVRIDQPWGEYQSRGEHRLAPLQSVDALIRSGVGLSAVELEVAMGYTSTGSARRDLLECSRLIDLWTMLDVPIYVRLVCPSSPDPDPKSRSGIGVDPRAWAGPCDENNQATWIERMLELFVAKPRIAGVFLPHFSDGVPHLYPNAGILRNDDSPKPVTDRIKSQLIRRKG